MKQLFFLLLVGLLVGSCSNEVTEVEVSKKAGVWVNSGTKFLMGSDDQVEIVKDLISNYDALNAEGVFTNTRDSLRFFSFNSKEPVIITSDNLKEMFSSYDSIVSSPAYFLPYELDGVRTIVEVTSREVKYNKNGQVEEDLFLEKYIFGKDGKIHTIRQWRAAW